VIDHVLHPEFGADVTFESFYNSLQKILKKAPKVSSTDAQLLMIEHYHEEFGITNYSDETMHLHPLNHVAMHPAEDPITGSFLVETMKRFANLKIGDIFKISFDAFLDQSQDRCELMFEIAEPMQKEMAESTDKIVKEIRKSESMNGLVDARGNPFDNRI
jgi:hypothetical protein